MHGMDQKDSCAVTRLTLASAFACAWLLAGVDAIRAVVSRSSWLVLLVWMGYAPCFLRCRQAHDARLHGRYDLRDSFAATHGRALVDLAMAARARLVLLVRCITCRVRFACRQARCQVLHGHALRHLHGLAGFLGYLAHRGVFPLIVGSSRRRQRWRMDLVVTMHITSACRQWLLAVAQHPVSLLGQGC